MSFGRNFMTTETYFFDSYALLEMLHQNENYAPYRQAKLVTTKLNLFEVYSACTRDYGTRYAQEVFEQLKGHASELEEDVIPGAAALRIRLSQKRMSMTDVIGYVTAAKKGIRFLTGDRQFEDLPNVEFVR